MKNKVNKTLVSLSQKSYREDKKMSDAKKSRMKGQPDCRTFRSVNYSRYILHFREFSAISNLSGYVVLLVQRVLLINIKTATCTKWAIIQIFRFSFCCLSAFSSDILNAVK